MANNIVVYIGLDNFDHILYLSRILSHLGKKVLLIDHSDTLSLKYSMPLPDGLDCSKEMIHYIHVEFTASVISEEMKNKYDDIIIFCGFNPREEDISSCNRMVFVTDQYRYNYDRVSSLYSAGPYVSQIEPELLVKEATSSKITTNVITDHMGITFSPSNINVLYFDERDYNNSLICHFNQSFKFIKVSKQLQDYLIREVARFYPEINPKEIISSYKRARKGG